jgi:peptide-methionine (S)-S-oxide reductase
MTTFVLGGGCFWCVDAVYRQLRGVTKVESGYAGGETDSPNYYQVASGKTGHAEVVSITFDESIIPTDVILNIFFSIHDPTTLNRQGADVGTQYRSIMLYQDKEQERMFKHATEKAKSIWTGTIVTELKPLVTFFVAEDEHQDYFNKQPDAGYCQVIIAPKVMKARATYATWFKEDE